MITRTFEGNLDVNTINDCCYKTLAAFRGATNINQISENDNCRACVANMVTDMGKSTCELRVQPPVLWNQQPHYFPNLLIKNPEIEDMEDAAGKCAIECFKLAEDCPGNENGGTLECLNNCATDFLAVALPKMEKNKLINTNSTSDTNKQMHEHSKHNKEDEDNTSYRQYEEANPWIFWVGFSIAGVLLSILLAAFIMAVFKK